MQHAKVSSCGRFVVLHGFHLDRTAVEALHRWAGEHRLGLQDAIQLAICAFNEGGAAGQTLLGASSEREHERRV